MQKVIITLLIGICFYTHGMAQKQSISKKQFDELWNKADSSAKIVIKTGNSTKDLNALERDNIKAIDIKQKTVTNPNYDFKKVDTSNLEELSTKPIVKGNGSKTTSKPKEAVINITPAKVKDTVAVKIKEIPLKETKVKESAPVKTTEIKDQAIIN